MEEVHCSHRSSGLNELLAAAKQEGGKGRKTEELLWAIYHAASGRLRKQRLPLADCEDGAMEIVAKSQERLLTIDDIERWVNRCVTNQLCDRWRRRQTRVEVALEDELLHHEVERAPLLEELCVARVLVDGLIADLARQRPEAALVAHYRIRQNLDVAETARRTGKTEGNVRALCHYAKKRLAGMVSD